MAEYKNETREEYFFHNTAGAEMPDTSTSGEAVRRLEADAPVLLSRFGGVPVFIPILFVSFFSIGAYVVWKSYQSEEKFESEAA